MKVTFEEELRHFTFEASNIEDLYQGIRDGLIAMEYHPNTANELKEELENER